MISIIIPVYNEETILARNAAKLRELSANAEIYFVDGGSTDRSREIAWQYGLVLHSEKGRAAQMNYGASQAKGDVLLFLHADNIISGSTLAAIEKTIAAGYTGGCLTQRIDNDLSIYRLIEWQGNIRARLTRVYYGDQGIFVRKNTFSSIGGFPLVPIMEDVLFTKKLRKYGKTIMLPEKVMVSARRWEKNGIFKTVLLYNLIIVLSWLRVPLKKIKLFYDDLR
ncbi:MAG: TIGR04283 family arsenosugar biosynthesis glycosyltransferase [bacterium]|nr:TIGR04283 family arsenosugar biosynthesis glycosyltransferase [bacterium]MDD5354541.1 TIGR04283 family arsenosugar biosynthesis glycosyltransferase [bacterium]MDD5757115.1 TIGR04283 family arsenosugar biosynthesis glycosyltransferase [bacterium]